MIAGIVNAARVLLDAAAPSQFAALPPVTFTYVPPLLPPTSILTRISTLLEVADGVIVALNPVTLLNVTPALCVYVSVFVVDTTCKTFPVAGALIHVVL